LQSDWKNKLFFGDNLYILREQVAEESVDLINLYQVAVEKEVTWSCSQYRLPQAGL
jgi:hypothetical protein